MKEAQKKCRKLRIVLRKIKYIQRWFRIWNDKKKLKKNVIVNNRNTYKSFLELQSWFQSEWPYIKDTGRVEIHYNSMGLSELQKLSMDKFEQKQNLQIGRIFNIFNQVFDIQNPQSTKHQVEVIYIASNQIPEDVIKYYYKVLNLIGIKS